MIREKVESVKMKYHVKHVRKNGVRWSREGGGNKGREEELLEET